MKKKSKKLKKKQLGSDEGSDVADSGKNKKTKNKSRLRRRREGSFVPSDSDSELSDDERKKKRKRKKKRSSKATTETSEESSFDDESRKGSKFTTEEDESTESKEVTEADLVEKMRNMIHFIKPDSQLWTKWTLGPLYRFLRKKDVMMVTALNLKVPISEESSKTVGSLEGTIPLPDAFKRILKLCPPDENGMTLVTYNEIIPGFSGELFYFLKQKPGKINGLNFEDVVLYGNIPEGHLDSFKALLGQFWTPLLTAEECLASGIKDEVFTDLNTLLCVSLNTSHFIGTKETLLYFPPEIYGERKDMDLAKDKGFCNRLEETITIWLKKFKEILILKELDDTEGWPGPLEEVKFWELRSQNFSNIKIQMGSPHMKRLVRILALAHSPFISELREMIREVTEASKEAISNLNYLQTISDPCVAVFKGKLKDTPIKLQKFLWVVLTIWKNAPYYNTSHRVNGLLRKFSNFLILHIQKRIKVDKLLHGLFIETTERTVKKFLRLLTCWKEIYRMTEKTIQKSQSEGEEWIFQYDLIFSHVDAMLQRLNNILEICQVQRLFGWRKGDIGEIEPFPCYPGLKRPYIANALRNAEEILTGKIESMRPYSSLILDIKNVEWHEHMNSFQETIVSIEIMIQNLLDEVFDQMSNLKQRMKLLYLFHRFSSRDVIVRELDKLSIRLYEYFEEEVLFLRKLFEQKIVPLPNTYSHLAGRGAWALYMKKRIENQLLILKKGESWLPKSGFAEYIKTEAKSLTEAMSSFAVKTYEDWSNSKEILEARNYRSKLDLTLLIRKGRENKDIVEVNLDRDLYKNLAEAEIWYRVGRPVPEQIMLNLFPIREKLHDLMENVSLIAKLYNELVTCLSRDERLMFKERLLPLEKKIYPCLVQFTWSSVTTADEYFGNEFLSLAREVKRRVKMYREANSKISAVCLKISKRVKVVKIDLKCVYDPDTYRSRQNEMIQSQISRIVSDYRRISDIIQEQFKFFKNDGSEVKLQWGKYAKLIDECFQEALCIGVRNSLRTLQSFVCCSEEKPIFQLEMKLDGNRLAFKPELKSLSEMILGTLANVAFALQPLKKISQYLGLGSIKGKFVKTQSFADALLEDEESLEIQEHLRFAIEKCFSEVNLFCDRWTPYRDIWELDKESFMTEYEHKSPTIEAYEKDLEKYLEISKVVQGSESVVNIRFLRVDCSKLREEIGKESASWFEMIARNLYRKAKSTLNEVHDFIEKYKRKLERLPENLEDQMNLFKLLQEAKKEEKDILALFPEFKEQFELLRRFEFELEPEVKDRLENLNGEWRSYQKFLKMVDTRLQKSYSELRDAFLDNAEVFDGKVDEFFKAYELKAPFSLEQVSMGQLENNGNYYEKALIYLENLLNDVKAMKQEEVEFTETLKIFNLPRDKNQTLIELEIEIGEMIKVWLEVTNWEKVWQSWKASAIHSINAKEGKLETDKFSQIFHELSKIYEKKLWPIINETIEFIETVQVALETVDFLKNKTLRDRHWEKIKELLGSKFDQPPENLSLEKVVQLKLHNYLEEISEISLSSGKETAVEKTLEKIEFFWSTEEFILKRRKSAVPFEIQFGQELQDVLMDHIVSLSAMKGSLFIGPFKEKIESWVDVLQRTNVILEKLVDTQMEWLFMERIFGKEELRREIPDENQQFSVCTTLWANIVVVIAEHKNITETVRIADELLETLENLEIRMGNLRKSLGTFLSGKRQDFPRFYFIPNGDLLDFIGNSSDPKKVQSMVSKMFSGFHELIPEQGTNNIRGVLSKEGELMSLQETVDTSQPVEFWLQHFEKAIKSLVKANLQASLADLMETKNEPEWLLRAQYPGQCCLTALRIDWTLDLTTAIQQTNLTKECETAGYAEQCSVKKIKKRLKKRIEQFSQVLKGKGAIRDNKSAIKLESNLERLKVTNVLMTLIYLKDVTERLYSRKCEDLESFEWLQHMRFYWEDGECRMRQGFTSIPYGYEFIGNREEVVITPLTERCFLALTTAISFQFGAYLHGSPDSGKKTTIMSLGNLLGKHVLNLSVSEETEIEALKSVITGVVQTGSWLVLENVNNLQENLITIISSKIDLISRAKLEGYQKVILDGLEVNLDGSCGIFAIVRGNPKENWKSLRSSMRPVAMIQPDTVNILQMKLFLNGFENSFGFAKKIEAIFSTAKEKLSDQNRCLFSLDGMLAVMKQAAEFKRAFGKRLNESEAIIKALQNIISSCLTTNENSHFLTVIRENFPNETPLKAENSVMEEFIRNSFLSLKYQGSDPMVRLCLRLYEILQVYQAVIIIGDTGSGKSVIRKVLKYALTSVSNEMEIKEYIINPMSFDPSELYGCSIKETEQWKDGILTKILKSNISFPQDSGKNVKDNIAKTKWIIFDGAVGDDSESESKWVEDGICQLINMDGLITLANLDRISLNKQNSIFVETDNVSSVSPGFISKAGVLLVNEQPLQWKLILKSWLLQLRSTLFKSELSAYVISLLEKCLKFRNEHCTGQPYEKRGDQTVTSSFIRMMNALVLQHANDLEKIAQENKDKSCFLLKQITAFCITWSLFGTLPEDIQQKANTFLKDIESKLFPSKGTVYDYYINIQSQRWTRWDDLATNYNLENPNSYFIHSSETARCSYFLTEMRSYSSLLLIGESNAGKTSTVKAFQTAFTSKDNIFLHAKRTPLMKARVIQALIESRLESVSSVLLSPNRGKTLTVFIDDLNEFSLMGQRETKINSDSYCEFLRHLVEHRIWFNRKTGNCLAISNLSIIAAMTTGKSPGYHGRIPPRLMSQFFLVTLPKPDEFKLRKIFTAILARKLEGFPPQVKSLVDDITVATLELHKVISNDILPTSELPLHHFDILDISRVYDGLLRVDRRVQDTKLCIIRLWFHECTRVYHDRLMDASSRQKFKEILAEQLLKHFELQPKNLMPPSGFLVFSDFMSKTKTYGEITDETALRKLLENVGNEMNGAKGRRVIIFLAAVKQIAKISRVISQEAGHLLNFGLDGIGRQTLTMLVCRFYNYQTFLLDDFLPTKSTMGHNLTQGMHLQALIKMIKQVYNLSGVERQGCCIILKDEHINDATLDLISVVTSTVEISELYSEQEFLTIKRKLLKTGLFKISKKREVNLLDDSNSSVIEYFKEEVRKNLHVVLCLNTTSSTFRRGVVNYSGILKQVTTTWFDIWKNESSWLEVARICCTNQNLKQHSCPEVFYAFHLIASEMGEKAKSEGTVSFTCITPTHLMDFVELYGLLQENVGSKIRDRMKTLKSATEYIGKVQARIGNLREMALKAEWKAVASRKECQELLNVIEAQEMDTNSQEELVNEKGEELKIEEKEVEEFAENLREEWSEALQEFEASTEILEDLAVEDLTHIRSYYSPPPLVSRVLDAVMIMLDRDQNWPEAKIQLGNPDFIRNIVQYDKARVTLEKLHSLKKFVQNKEFTPEAVAKYSNGARILCAWILGMEKYGRIYLTQIIPKREKLGESESSLEEKKLALELSAQKLQLLQENWKELKGIYEAKFELKKDREEDHRKSTEILQRAEKVQELMKNELLMWEQHLGQLETKLENLHGDSLMAAAYLMYLGPFNETYRNVIKKRWMEYVMSQKGRTTKFTISSDWKLITFLNHPLIQLKILSSGIQRDDEHFIENCLISENLFLARNILFIDPNDVAEKVLLHLDDKNKVKQCKDAGTLRIVEVEEVHLAQVMKFSVKLPSETDVTDKLHVTPSQKLAAKITDSNPNLNSSTVSDFTIINFSLTSKGLTDYLAISIAKHIDSEGVAKRESLLKTALLNEQCVNDLKERIPSLIITCGGSILDSGEFPQTLSNWKREIMEAEEQLKQVYEEVSGLDRKIEQFHEIAEKFCEVFTVLNELSKLHVSLEISLTYFSKLIGKSIHEYFQLKTTDSSSPRRDLMDAITFIGKTGYLNVLRHLRKTMLRQHRYYFALLLSLKKVANKPEDLEFLFEKIAVFSEAGNIESEDRLLKFNGNETEGKSKLTQQLSQQLQLALGQYEMLERLGKIGCFDGLLDSIVKTDSEAWTVWMKYSEPENKFPGLWDIKLKGFEKLIILSILRPDRLFAQIEIFSVEMLGAEVSHCLFLPQLLDLKEIYEDRKFLINLDNSKDGIFHPVVFFQEENTNITYDPKLSILSLSKSLKPSQKVYTLQVSESNLDVARKLTEEAMVKGFWVYFPNCELFLDWIWELETILKDKRSETIHNGFCLWLSFKLSDCSFPREILRHSIQLALEPIQTVDLRLSRLFQKMSSGLKLEPLIGSTQRFKRLLFGLSYLHCILLGHPKGGNFNDLDFEIATTILKAFTLVLNQERIQWWALKLMLELQYNNHFPCQCEKQQYVSKMIQKIFCEEAVTQPEYRLSDSDPIITMPPLEDEEDKQQSKPSKSMNGVADTNILSSLQRYVQQTCFASLPIKENAEDISKMLRNCKQMKLYKKMKISFLIYLRENNLEFACF